MQAAAEEARRQLGRVRERYEVARRRRARLEPVLLRQLAELAEEETEAARELAAAEAAALELGGGGKSEGEEVEGKGAAGIEAVGGEACEGVMAAGEGGGDMMHQDGCGCGSGGGVKQEAEGEAAGAAWPGLGPASSGMVA